MGKTDDSPQLKNKRPLDMKKGRLTAPFENSKNCLSGAPGYVEDAGATPAAFFQEATVPSLETR
jgi:hypothetical protein